MYIECMLRTTPSWPEKEQQGRWGWPMKKASQAEFYILSNRPMHKGNIAEQKKGFYQVMGVVGNCRHWGGAKQTPAARGRASEHPIKGNCFCKCLQTLLAGRAHYPHFTDKELRPAEIKHLA